VATSGDDNGVPVLSELQHCNIEIQWHSEPFKSLKDSGAQISLIKQELIQDLKNPCLGTILVKGVVGRPVEANLVTLQIRPSPDPPMVNIAPYIPIVFEACDLSVEEDVILSTSVIEQLHELSAYNVTKSPRAFNEPVLAEAVTTRSMARGSATQDEKAVSEVRNYDGDGTEHINDNSRVEQISLVQILTMW